MVEFAESRCLRGWSADTVCVAFTQMMRWAMLILASDEGEEGTGYHPPF
jgi:hypothetical protein